MNNWNMPTQPPKDIWGPPPANQPAPNVWGAPPPPTNPQPSPQTAPGMGHNVPPGQELTPDEKKLWESFKYDEGKLTEAWQLQADSLQVAKWREMSLRTLVFKIRFPAPTEGTNNLALADGSTLKAVVKYNYKLDRDVEKVEAALNLLERLGGHEGKFIGERLVLWTPDLVKKEYDILIEDAVKDKTKEQMLLAFNQVVTKTPATPALEIKAPKDKAK